jgi:hypothetical protein
MSRCARRPSTSRTLIVKRYESHTPWLMMVGGRFARIADDVVGHPTAQRGPLKVTIPWWASRGSPGRFGKGVSAWIETEANFSRCLPAFMRRDVGHDCSRNCSDNQPDDLRTPRRGKSECPVRSETPITWEEEIQW